MPEEETAKNKANMIAALGMTVEEYEWNIEWIENLIRNYHKVQGSMDCLGHRLSGSKSFDCFLSITG